jgi:hypothetical protein
MVSCADCGIPMQVDEIYHLGESVVCECCYLQAGYDDEEEENE